MATYTKGSIHQDAYLRHHLYTDHLPDYAKIHGIYGNIYNDLTKEWIWFDKMKFKRKTAIGAEASLNSVKHRQGYAPS